MRIETKIKLNRYQPRDYQLPIVDAIENKGYKRVLAIMPRRCLSGSTHITMSDGSFKFLRDIKIGDKILSWNGESFEPDTVKNSWSTGTKKTCKVQAPGYLPLFSSLNHRFANTASSGTIVSWDELQFIGKYRSILQYAGKSSGITSNMDLAEFWGFMLADGHVSHYQQPKFTNTRKDILDRVEYLALKLFDINVIWRPKGNGFDLGFSNKTLGGGSTPNPIKELFRREGADVPKYERRLPKSIWSYDTDSILSFFRALISADGNIYLHKSGFIDKKSKRIIPTAVEITLSCGKNYDYSWDIYWLLRKIGVVPQVPYKERDSNWKIKISKSHAVKLLLSNNPIYGKEDLQKDALYYLDAHKKKTGVVNGCFRSKAVISESEDEELYDLESTTNSNFIANGYLVHNSGKDVTAWNIMIRAALKKVGVYFYCAPTYSQGRKIIWDSITNEGVKFLDYIPDELIDRKNDQQMKVHLVNGSLIQVIGSDSYDKSLVGSNPQAIVFTEWALADPRAYQFARPILTANEGWALFISCVTPNTLVIGENGLRRISSVSDSREEYSDFNKPIWGLGGFHNAEQFYYGGKQETRIVILESGYQIECTPVHPLWNGSEWIKSKDLKVGDLLPVQYGQDVWGNGIDVSLFEEIRHGSRLFRFDYDNLDANFFYLLGLIHADGNYDRNKVTITNKKDPEIKEFLVSNGFITRKDGIHHDLSSRTMVEFLEWIGFKHGARNKEFPDRLFECTKSQLTAFLQGLFDGDGTSNSSSKKRGVIKLTSTCLSFVKDIQVLLSNFGVICSIYTEDKAPTKRVKVWSRIYNLEITGHFAHVFYRDIGFRLERKQKNWEYIPASCVDESGNVYPVDTSKLIDYSLPKNVVTNPERMTRRLLRKLNDKKPHPYIQHLLSEKLFYSPIKEIIYSENEVFDFVIPETNSFFSNSFISHNTPRGKNHMWEMYQIAQNSPDWFSYKTTVLETCHIPLSEIEREKRSGEMSEDLIQQEYYCFPGTQEILALNELKPISDIKINDMVISHSGRSRKVLDTIKRDYEGEMIKIYSFGSPEPLICTPCHPIRVFDKAIQTYSWKNAGDITVKDRLVFPKMPLGMVQLISYDLCMLIAWYICEGSSFKNGVQFTVGGAKEVDRVTSLLCKISIEYSLFISETGTSTNIVVYSTQLADFFKSICGTESNNKRIPFSWIATHEIDFFHELMWGDGCYSVYKNYKKFSYTTTSKTLAYQIQLLANSLNLGYAAGITNRKGTAVAFPHGKTYNCQDSYSVQIGIKGLREKSGALTRAKYGIAARIKNIEREYYKGSVYNIKVQYDESYVVLGRSVHNCSFDMGVEGSYYAKYLDQIRQKGQIGIVPWEPSFSVHTVWDIGVRDSTTIIFYQIVGQIIRVIDCYENSKEGLEHYINYLQTKEYTYGKHFAPHDIAVKEWGSGMTRIEKARQLGIKFITVSNVSIQDGIEAVRSTLPKMWFDKENCAPLLKALENYRQEWDEKRKVYKPVPLHNWSSHFADAARYLALSLPKTRDGLTPEELNKHYQEARGFGQQLPWMFNNK
jgi:intein/homing endonuclease